MPLLRRKGLFESNKVLYLPVAVIAPNPDQPRRHFSREGLEELAASIKESSLYPILRKLEQNGYLSTYNQEFQGRNRKYYSITEQGKEQLLYLKKEWNVYKETIDGIIEGRLKK